MPVSIPRKKSAHWAQMKHTLVCSKPGTKPHFIGFYVPVMGLQGRPWNDCKGKEKDALRKRFDALKSSSHDKGRSDLEAALNMIGVVEKSKA